MKSDAADVRLRPMREADVDQVMAIAASLKDAPHWLRGAYLSALNRGAATRRIALVAESLEEGIVLGFTVVCLILPQAELETIAVAAEARREGIGRKLISALREELKAEGVREVLLEVRASNQRAIGFYGSLGWHEAGRRPRYYADPEEDAVLMNLALG
jgi:ribosomal-protein-alanine N-acetyltransferase